MDRKKLIDEIVEVVMKKDPAEMRDAMRELLKGLRDSDLIILHDRYKGA